MQRRAESLIVVWRWWERVDAVDLLDLLDVLEEVEDARAVSSFGLVVVKG